MNSVLSFILVLGVLIFVHELGHFLLAKAFGVRVLKFSLGFGNKLVGKKWGETEYLISAFPLGGYVKMYGEQQEEEVLPEDRHRSFSHKPVWQRFGIVFGGPLFNLLFAVGLFFLLFVVAGMPEPVDSTKIGEVNPESAAAQAGLKAGDAVLSINGKPTTSWEHVSEAIRDSQGNEVTLVVLREGQELTIGAKPTIREVKNLFGETTGERYMLGIVRSEEIRYVDASIAESAKAAVVQTWNLGYLTVMGIVKMIQRVIPASELGGPIRIAELAGQQLEAGWMNLLYFMGLLSVNLGILNLLPIPVLDGGHLVFLSLEAVRRRPLSERTMEISQRVGIAILGTLMIFVFYNDILRLVKRWLMS
ncbi:site-2 protease [Desulfobulbus propionicus DSM 2032]|jgi:regulator of sigma E protease|uniref:Zinc metalloprotease n=1 Tax=Desulfobulbus propionicus (strain ATCC 33891 / DSM 2032 / VKM B-1956 / 1pr3) TaxID=577650 RepID=A0A7U3YKD0_DESPD|nr:RIP metalloprotease RseP [Desulfobulbus propionicus]ADW16997.1 site-2 protease [Desulfobulbus propionicus DSM 2032]